MRPTPSKSPEGSEASNTEPPQQPKRQKPSKRKLAPSPELEEEEEEDVDQEEEETEAGEEAFLEEIEGEEFFEDDQPEVEEEDDQEERVLTARPREKAVRTTRSSQHNMASTGKSSKQEQARVSSLLLDTVALLCKNGLTYRREMKIQGTLGITLDDDSVFVVQINENVSDQQTPKRTPATASPSKSHDRSNLRKRQADFAPATRAPADKRRGEVIVIGDGDNTPRAPYAARGRGRPPFTFRPMVQSPRKPGVVPNYQPVS